MTTLYVWQQLSKREQDALLQRPIQTNQSTIKGQVADIIAKVREFGDRALAELTQQFDGVTVDHWRVPDEAMIEAGQHVDTSVQEAILLAKDHITRYHTAQMPKSLRVETCPGVFCEKVYRPIERVGLYVPGGSAPLVSTVLMLSLPAKIVGCQLPVLVTPPRQDGSVHPAILFAARVCGVEHVYQVGGAQAIAALAYGTASVPKVDKIFGPGNAWVTQAKMAVAQDPQGASCDMPAGPSEVLVIADGSAKPDIVAADLLAQAEHGPDSQAILLTPEASLAEQVKQQMIQQCEVLPRRHIVEQACRHSRLIVVESVTQALALSNRYAPEHLILNTQAADSLVEQVTCAGSVFVGPWAAEAFGDYLTGSNHVLPTYGYARSVSGLSPRAFMTSFSVQTMTQQGMQAIAPATEMLAQLEGLQAHANAARKRWEL